MKKLIFIFFLLAVCSTFAQTNDNESLQKLNQNTVSAYNNRKFDEALQYAQQALSLSLKINGENSEEASLAHKNLGIIYSELKKFKTSAEHLQKALEIYQKNKNADVKNLLELYNSLALSQSLSGMKKEAEINLLKAIEVAENTFGKDSRETIKPILEMAIFHSKADDYEKSRDYYLKTYALVIKHFGKDSDEMEMVRIYSSYYSGGSGVWSNDKRYKEYKKKLTELFGYEQGDAFSLPMPRYPNEAIKEKKQGKIIVKVWLDEQGNVTNAKAVYGEMFFKSVAEEAAKKAKFKSSLQNGKPISAINYIVYRFLK